MKPTYNLFITYSNQRARTVRAASSVGVFDRVVTLGAWIRECFEKRFIFTRIDEILAPSIMHHLIHTHHSAYFDYLDEQAQSLTIIYNFIVSAHRSRVPFEKILSGAKLDAMRTLDAHYQAYKKQHHLVDQADVERLTWEAFDQSWLDDVENLYVDDFQVGDISYVESWVEAAFLERWVSMPRIPIEVRRNTQARLVRTKHEIFDDVDEIKTALKIARKLMQEGASSDVILIVASDITHYAPLFKLFLDEYGLKGFSSHGTKLLSYKHAQMHPAYRARIQAEIATYRALFSRLGLAFSDAHSEHIAALQIIGDERIGIELTEPNQLIGTTKTYEHIIFVGTDINHFPPKFAQNFLYSHQEAIEYFYANNLFLDSKTQYETLKSLTKNLYVLTANYSGKRALARSIVIHEPITETIDVSDILGLSDRALLGQTQTPDASTAGYYQSITSHDYTPFDGKEVQDMKVAHLSASAINKYLACPLSYLYSYKLRVQPPKAASQGYDAAQQGTLMHLCFELFGRAIQSNAVRSLDEETLYALMHTCSQEAYAHPDSVASRGVENIHHKLYLAQLQTGLHTPIEESFDHTHKGLLAKFVDYYIKHAQQFDYFSHTDFEAPFALDTKLEPCEIDSPTQQDVFIKGAIDRLDVLTNDVTVIDYKSSKIFSQIDKARTQKIQELKDVQLALYLLYVSQKYPNRNYHAHLLSFKGVNPYYHFANLSSVVSPKEGQSVHYDTAYESTLKARIFDVHRGILAGDFSFDAADETVCGYCDVKYLCHQSVLNKEPKGTHE